ncbi:hypothetical protein DPMN_035833 [Dreissena polymorpha]|uniref:Uncharacterized protein n=1 Tax=Dreissena polymorpha TaxID=45954 RepID=A0A9D4MAA6_DREPO|nr:hypothetical protein DPMN_065701 [Dreissena polymorpha]KAH3728824.1 hypothetical protein DPMN_054786 [Dreissena polymorpha]KAH3734621.1 hypothetical protein DPMN_041060 [Dreissena polymorpha]KAH3735200.1 hypothetical protein DPMN_041662 [Dreissena polymorpha]KAH3737535.1 hypothetical protein DPMN_044128 [Dreissena polymorpha]
MAVVFVIQDGRRRTITNAKAFKGEIVLENLRDENIASIYRLSKGGIERLLVLIGEDIAPTCRRAHPFHSVA